MVVKFLKQKNQEFPPRLFIQDKHSLHASLSSMPHNFGEIFKSGKTKLSWKCLRGTISLGVILSTTHHFGTTGWDGPVLLTTDREVGATVAQLVEALHYKLAGRGFDSQWCQWIFSLT
jgi:hypothetical protein